MICPLVTFSEISQTYFHSSFALKAPVRDLFQFCGVEHLREKSPFAWICALLNHCVYTFVLNYFSLKSLSAIGQGVQKRLSHKQMHPLSASFLKTMLIFLHLRDVELKMDTPVYFIFMLLLGLFLLF